MYFFFFSINTVSTNANDFPLAVQVTTGQPVGVSQFTRGTGSPGARPRRWTAATAPVTTSSEHTDNLRK